jgi:hypothetical protein
MVVPTARHARYAGGRPAGAGGFWRRTASTDASVWGTWSRAPPSQPWYPHDPRHLLELVSGKEQIGDAHGLLPCSLGPLKHDHP